MKILNRIAYAVEEMPHVMANWTGSSWSFLVVAIVTVGWLIAGPFLHFSAEWEMWMATASSVTSFFMVFLLQRSQNKSSLAMQLKLNEIIAAQKGANNHLINLEDASESKIKSLYKHYQDAAAVIHEAEHLSTERISVEALIATDENPDAKEAVVS